MTAVEERVPRAEQRGDGRRRGIPWLALGLGLVALALAIAAASGPARPERIVATWPPEVLPDDRPDREWYAPLFLSNRLPESIEIALPCDLPSALPAAGERVLVVGTASHSTNGALAIERVGRGLEVIAGGHRLATIAWPPDGVDVCPLHIRVAGGLVRLPGRTVPTGIDAPTNMPQVTGLFTELDLRSGDPPRIVVTGRPFQTTATTRQLAFGLGAAGLALTALALLLARRPRAALRRSRDAVGSARAGVGPEDAVVAVGLLAWLVLSPAYIDDGYVWLGQTNYFVHGAFSNVYAVFGTNGLVFWLDWLQHWVSGATSDLVLLRVPSVLALAVAWVVARRCLTLALGGSGVVVRWVLVAAFLLGALAWGVTLRPEPFVLLLVLSTLLAALSFAAEPRSGVLVAAVLLIGLSVTSHPAGVVALGSAFAVLPSVIRWLRGDWTRLAALVAAILASGALVTLLAFADSDIGTRLGDSATFAEADAGSQNGITSEWRRYVRLRDGSWGVPMRRLSVALMLLVVVAYATRRRSAGTGISLVPARSLAFGLLLLSVVPSKWPFHFGALAGVASVAIATESARLLGEGRASGSTPWRPLAAASAVIVAAVWSAMPALPWGVHDLQTVSWDAVFGFGRGITPAGVGWMLGIVASLLVATWASERRRRGTRLQADGTEAARLAAWSIIAVIATIVAVTSSVLVIDAVRSPWTLARQNAGTFIGNQGCGRADQVEVAPDGGDERGGTLTRYLDSPGTRTLLDPALAPYFPCATPARIRAGIADLPDLVLAWGVPWPAQAVTSPFAGIDDLFRLGRIAETSDGVVVYRVRASRPGSARAAAAVERVYGTPRAEAQP